MNERQRQTLYMIGVMTLLVVVVLYLLVYASDPIELYRPDYPTWKEIGKWLLETFNIFNYL